MLKIHIEMYINQINKWYFYCYSMLIIGLILIVLHCNLLSQFDVKLRNHISALWSKSSNWKTSVTTTKEECETLDACGLRKSGASPCGNRLLQSPGVSAPKSARAEMNKATAGPDSHHKLDQTGRGAAAVWRGRKAQRKWQERKLEGTHTLADVGVTDVFLRMLEEERLALLTLVTHGVVFAVITHAAAHVTRGLIHGHVEMTGIRVMIAVTLCERSTEMLVRKWQMFK